MIHHYCSITLLNTAPFALCVLDERPGNVADVFGLFGSVDFLSDARASVLPKT